MWLEAPTGVRYETMRRHNGKRLRLEGASQLRKIARSAGRLAPRLPPRTRTSRKTLILHRKRSAKGGTWTQDADWNDSLLSPRVWRRMAPCGAAWPPGAKRLQLIGRRLRGDEIARVEATDDDL